MKYMYPMAISGQILKHLSGFQLHSYYLSFVLFYNESLHYIPLGGKVYILSSAPEFYVNVGYDINLITLETAGEFL